MKLRIVYAAGAKECNGVIREEKKSMKLRIVYVVNVCPVQVVDLN